MNHKRLLLSFGLFLLLSFVSHSLFSQSETAVAEGPDLEAGQKLFKSKCATCHQVKKKLIGPALEGMEQRWEEAGEYEGKSGKEWLYTWIRNNKEAIESGYPYALEMQAFDPSEMNLFPQLSDEDIDNILAYVEQKATEEPEVAGPGPAGTGDGAAPPEADNTLLYILLGLLAVILLILWRVTTVLNRLVLEKKGEPIPEPVPIYQNKKLITTIVLVGVIYIGYVTVDGAIALGKQEGYQPEQPIKFSHKLHAGANQIDCQYCHAGARKGRTAMIPSPNICMNCHTAVTQGPQYGTEEIGKIYAAIGFDPEKRAYIEDYEQKPIEWVKIHNLPDHVYFNHAQHVVAGGVECQTCHGPVEEMEVVYQHAPLSMGWCVNCHRDTEVKFQQNEYYDIYEKYHEEIKNGERTAVTVEDIGGTECQKCHY